MDPLLELLHQNSKLSSAELGKLLNLSAAQVEAKIASYEEAGVILAYQAVIDAERTDPDAVTAYIEVKITPERGGGFDRLAGRIARFDEVKSCWLMSGGDCFGVFLEGKQIRGKYRFFFSKMWNPVRGNLAANPFPSKNLKKKT